MPCGPYACPPNAPTPEVQPIDSSPVEGIPTWEQPTPSNCLPNGTLFFNTVQTYVDTCPVSSSTPAISVTIPANTYTSSISQQDADDQALTSAQTQATAHRLLNPCIASVTSVFLLAEDGDFLLTESGDFLIIA